jgi:hypothetical protein
MELSMVLNRFLFVFFAFMGLATYGYAQDEGVQDGSSHNEELNERDFQALREYLKTKREVPLEDKDENLSISGDVRFEWRHMNESGRGGNQLRGSNRINPVSRLAISRNDFDCEFNLKFDYVLDKTWAVAHLQYDNSAGVDSQDIPCFDDKEGWFGSGRCDDLCLKKAYFGYNLWNDPCSRMDIELGRRGNLYYVFDSRVQFLSRLDGVIFKYEGALESIPKYYAKLAGFVVDERVNRFAWATEVGFMNILDSGVDFKYSFIDWMPHNKIRCAKKCCEEIEGYDGPRNKGCFEHNPQAFQFYVSQWTMYYRFDPDLFCGKPAQLYGAFLMNHGRKYARVIRHTDIVATKHNVKNHQAEANENGFEKIRANLGWYVGFLVGEVKKEGDWSLEVQYQVVQALAVPEQDEAGISRGNVLSESFTRYGRGYTNYKGWKVETLYAITDNLSLDGIIEASREANRRIGGRHRYSKVELEAIYAF